MPDGCDEQEFLNEVIPFQGPELTHGLAKSIHSKSFIIEGPGHFYAQDNRKKIRNNMVRCPFVSHHLLLPLQLGAFFLLIPTPLP